ncbi:hypothetical protein VOLCADRAFT_86859 [Volvox carteri f. nagariensis]|uniref:URB1 N-terminal domain-containing protein n=1 Tax=Volvox carteri f. nagariensis TaxID=3068 RepID=D8TJT2_VOLCA|nr:uncharacterized protein VOLCADRAFT_86859 [Volvox carteri f. nagariensis]EFJ52598.1 hypothetical protein VOLCADRAFT_86859 [Volvox carteri f. nagariensis]|eukprot:XP_002946671.1 hypothetical protein VOLCADRAFT_86859 [Volvox carteri f. nagariensis]
MSTAAIDSFDLVKTTEALRAIRELDVNLSGLKALHDAISRPGPQGWQHLLSYMRISPACTELCNIWEAQATIKDPRVFPQLLLLIADILAAKPPAELTATEAPTQDSHGHTRRRDRGYRSGDEAAAVAAAAAAPPAAAMSFVSSAQQQLISLALGRRLKSLYHALGSDHQPTANAALQLLTAIAAHSVVAARDLVTAFDWSLSALTRISRPSKERPERGAAGSQQQQQQQQSNRRRDGGATASAWDRSNVLFRPRRAMFVRFCRALLDSADHATLARLLPLRALTGGLLHHMAADPPGHVLQTLLILGRRVLAPAVPGGAAAAAAAAAALPPRLRAEPFGDVALAQLAEIAASSDEPAEGAEGRGNAAAAAAEAALEVLVMLCTNPANGLMTYGSPDSGAAAGAPQHGPGVKRLLRLLPRLRPLDHVRHVRLLNEVATRCPWLAAEFASSLPYDLQPKLSSRWVAAMTLAARLTAAAAVAPSPLLDRLTTAAAPPPSADSPIVRAHMRCCMPPALSKAVLSRGLQHDRPVVQALTLDAVAAMMRSVEPLLALVAASAAAAAAAGASGGGTAAWPSFHRRLCSTVRARLPDLGILQALHTALEKRDSAPTATAAAAAVETLGAALGRSKSEKAAAGKDGGGGRVGSGGAAKDGGDVRMKDVAASTAVEMDEQEGSDAGRGGGEEEEEAGAAEEEEGGSPGAVVKGGSGSGSGAKGGGLLAAAVFGAAVARDPSRVRLAVLVRLLDVIASYCRLLPDAAADAHFDAVKLLPPGDVLALDEQHQAALMGVLAAAVAEPAAAAGFGPSAAPLSTALVLPLLRLLTGAASPAVRQSAGELLVCRLKPLLLGGMAPTAAEGPGASAAVAAALAGGGADVPYNWGWDELELRIWLWMLPSQPVPRTATAAAAAAPEVSPLVGGGADAVLSFLANLAVAASRRPQCPSRGPVSPLAALSLRNCLRLLRSRRSGARGEQERAAVCGYVAGVLHLLTQQLDDPWVMLHLLERALLADKATAAAAAAPPPEHEPPPPPPPSSSVPAGQAISLPPEGQPLRSLYDWLRKSCRSRAALVATVPDVVGAPCVASGGLDSSAPGNLRVEVVGDGSGDGGGGDSTQPDGDAESTATTKSLSKKLRECVKAAAKVLKKDRDGGGGHDSSSSSSCSQGLPAAACAHLAEAASLASLLLSRHCTEPAEAAAHAVRLLQLAVRKTPPSLAATGAPAAADDDPGSVGNGKSDLPAAATAAVAAPPPSVPGPRELLLAALWIFALLKPLASRCILVPAEMLCVVAAEGDGGAGEEGGAKAGESGGGLGEAEEDVEGDGGGGQGWELGPSAAALEVVTGGSGGGGSSGSDTWRWTAAAAAWDGQLPALVLMQGDFLWRRRGGGGRLGSAVDVDGGGGGVERFGATAASFPSWALIAAAGSVPFWLRSLASSPGGAAAAFQLVRQLLPAAQPAAGPSAELSSAAVRHVGSSLKVVACGTLLRVLRSSAAPVAVLLAAPLATAAAPPQRHGRRVQNVDSCIGAVASAACRHALRLLGDLWIQLTTAAAVAAAATTTTAGAVMATATIAAGAWPGAETAGNPTTFNAAAVIVAVRAACARHIRAAVACLRTLLTRDEARRCSGGSDDVDAAVEVLLPLARHGAAGQLLPLVQELLAAAAAAAANTASAAAVATAAPEVAPKAKRKAKAAANGVLEPAAVARQQRLLEAGLALAASVLADPRALLGGFGARASGGDVISSSSGGNRGEGGEREEANDDGDASSSGGNGVRLRQVFAAVQAELVSLVCGTGVSGVGDGGGGGAAERAAELASTALCCGLQGPAGHILALEVTADALEACVRLAPRSVAAADAAAAALALGPPALHARFAAVLPAVVTAEEQRRPGLGRRLALARLLPAADTYTRLAEAAYGRSAADVGGRFVASDPVVRAFREPLFAYLTRKARKVTAAAAAAAANGSGRRRRSRGDGGLAAAVADSGLPRDAVERLRTFAVPLLARLLHLSYGVPLSLDGDDDGDDEGSGDRGGGGVRGKGVEGRGTDLTGRPPLASSAEQLALAEALLRDAVLHRRNGGRSDGGEAAAAESWGTTELAAVAAVLGAATATLAALYGKGVLPSGAGGSAAQRRLLATASGCLDGSVGDLLADLPDSAREGPAFAAICRTVQPLATATAVHAASDRAALRCLRRVLAALLPQAAAGGNGDGGDAAAATAPAKDTDKDVEMEAADTETDDENGKRMQEGVSEDDVDDVGADAMLLPYGLVPNAVAAAAAGEMLESFITTPALLTMFAPPATAAAAPPPPPALARLPLPLVSLLSVGDVAGAGGLTAVPRQDAAQTDTDECRTAAAVEALRTEFATLLETLLDLRLAYDTYDQHGRHCGKAGAGNRSDGAAAAAAAAAATAAAFGHGAAERTVLEALLQLLQCAYGASLRESDRAVLRVLLRLDELLLPLPAADSADGDDADDPRCADLVTRRLSGGSPLARSGYVCGTAARQYYQASAAAQAAAYGTAAAGAAADRTALRTRAVTENQLSDPRVIALACVCFPAGRTLAAEEDDPWAIPSAAPAAAAADELRRPRTTSCSDGGDPAWLLPYTVCCLRDGAATVQDLAGWGLLPLCLRCLAVEDVGLRTLSYEALALAAAQLDSLEAAAAAAAAAAGGGSRAAAARAIEGKAAAAGLAGPAALGSFLPAAAAATAGGGAGSTAGTAAAGVVGPSDLRGAHRAAADFRQRQQLQALLAHVRNAVTAPLQQLPHLSALFAAEAAVVLMQPQGPLDGSICRRKFVAEVCQALYGSRAAALDAAAGGGGAGNSIGVDGEAPGTIGAGAGAVSAAGGSGGGGGGGLPVCSSLALDVLAALSRLPALGRHLVMVTGFVPWLGHLAASAVQDAQRGRYGSTGAAVVRQVRVPHMSSEPAALPAAAVLALGTLRDLIRRRVCLRRHDGDAAVHQYGQAAGTLARAARACGSGELAAWTCSMLAGLAAALPPWRTQPLWRAAATPAVLLQLYGVITTSAGGGGGGEGALPTSASTRRLQMWLQAVLRSSFPVPPPAAPAAIAAAIAVVGAVPHSNLGNAEALTLPLGSGAVQRLVCTAITAALSLSRSASAASHRTLGRREEGDGGGGGLPGRQPAAVHPPTHTGSHGGMCCTAAAAATARACLLWLASLAAAGHCLCPPRSAAIQPLSEALYELVAIATSPRLDPSGPATAAAATSSAAAAAFRVTLLSHAVCQRSLLAADCRPPVGSCTAGGGGDAGGRGGHGGAGDDSGSGGKWRREELPEDLWRCAGERLQAVLGPRTPPSLFATTITPPPQPPQPPRQGVEGADAAAHAWLRAARVALAEAEAAEVAEGQVHGAAWDYVGCGGCGGWEAAEGVLQELLLGPVGLATPRKVEGRAFIIKNYLPIAFLVALGLALAWPVPGRFLANVSILGNVRICQVAAMVLVFLITGLQLNTTEVKRALALRNLPVVMYGFVSILIATPCLGFALRSAPLDPWEFATGLAIFTVAPTTLGVGVALTEACGGNRAMALLLTVGTNALAVFTMPPELRLLLPPGHAGKGSTAGGPAELKMDVQVTDLLIKLAITVLVPFILGKFAREAWPAAERFAKTYRVGLSLTSTTSLAFVVWQTLSAARDLLLAQRPGPVFAMMGLAVSMHLLYLLGNYLVVWFVLRAPLREAIAVVIMASQKSAPVAVTTITFMTRDAAQQGLLSLPAIVGQLCQIFIGAALAKWLARVVERSEKAEEEVAREEAAAVAAVAAVAAEAGAYEQIKRHIYMIKRALRTAPLDDIDS